MAVNGFRRSPSPNKQSTSPAISIGIENSGYAKFRNIPLPSVVEAGPAAIMEALAERASGRSSGQSSNQSLPLGDMAGAVLEDNPHGSIFSRQITMGYTKSWTTTVKEKLQKLEHEARARRGHSRGDSAASWESFDQGNGGGGNNSDAVAQGMRPRGYGFTSPWNGQCEFRTGNGGRTLRCTHALDSNASGNYASERPPSTVISELRFNLPASELFPNNSHAKDSQLLSNLGKVLRRDGAGHDEDGDGDDGEPPSLFGMHLGKEKAGGGKRGNRAKMGKLIITGEGLKMLDLVVAANIGVWWETWERGF